MAWRGWVTIGVYQARATRASAYCWAHHVSTNLREATMPLSSTLSHVLKLSCNAKLPSHITSVRCFGRVAQIPGFLSSTHRCLLSFDSFPPESRVMPRHHSAKSRPRVRLAAQSTQASCLPVVRTSAKCPSNGTGLPDRNSG